MSMRAVALLIVAQDMALGLAIGAVALNSMFLAVLFAIFGGLVVGTAGFWAPNA